jgi:hypothetical protein
MCSRQQSYWGDKMKQRGLERQEKFVLVPKGLRYQGAIKGYFWNIKKKNFVASVRKQTTPTERPPLVSEVSDNFFADRGHHVVSVTNPYGSILGFLDRSHYYFFQVPPQLYSRGWVDPVPDPLLFFFLYCPGIEPGTSGSVVRYSGYRSDLRKKRYKNLNWIQRRGSNTWLTCVNTAVSFNCIQRHHLVF